MLKYVLTGRFAAGDRVSFEGPLDVYLADHTISVGPPQLGLGSKRLHIAPFCGSMFFGRSYREGRDIVEKGFELAISGTNLGVYEEGGGPDGDFDIFDVEAAEIRGTFGPRGLTVAMRATTSPGAQVCYSLGDRREAAFAALGKV